MALNRVGVAVEGEGVRKSICTRGSGVSPQWREYVRWEWDGVGVEAVERDEGEDGVGVGVFVALEEDDGLWRYCLRFGAGAC